MAWNDIRRQVGPVLAVERAAEIGEKGVFAAKRSGGRGRTGRRFARLGKKGAEGIGIAGKVLAVDETGELGERIVVGRRRRRSAQAPLEFGDVNFRAKLVSRLTHFPPREATQHRGLQLYPPSGNQRISSGAFTPRTFRPDASTEVNEQTKASLAFDKSLSFSLRKRNCG